MPIDMSFLGSEGGAPSAEPTTQASAVDSAAVTEPVLTPTPEPAIAPATDGTQLDTAVAATEPVPALETPTGDPALAEELDEAAIEKLLSENPNSPKWFRDQLKKVAGYSGKLKAEKSELQTQFESLKTQYEGKESLAPTDLERMRAAEERQYKLSSFTATPEEVLSSIKEVINPNKFAEIKNQLAWEFLEDANGQPDLGNLQVIVDRFSGFKEGDSRVEAKDVLNAIQALKRGTVKAEELHEFSSDAEYEAFTRARSIDSEIEVQRQLARDNAQYQETQTRQSLLQNVVGTIQGQFQPQVEALMTKFQLTTTENEPKVAAEFKQAIRDRVAAEVNAASINNPHLTDVFKAIDLLSKPSGMKAEQIQAEIQAYTNSFPYQTALSRGMSELMGIVEKRVAQEAYQYKLLMIGWEQEVSKGQHAREVIGQPKQTEVLSSYTPEQLAAMSVNERRHTILKNVSDQLREKSPSRYGG